MNCHLLIDGQCILKPEHDRTHWRAGISRGCPYQRRERSGAGEAPAFAGITGISIGETLQHSAQMLVGLR